MSDKFSTIILSIDNYDEFTENIYLDLGEILRILFKSGYVCVVREEEASIIRIDFNYDVYKEFGNPIPAWLDDEEIELLYSHSTHEEIKECCGKCKND